MYYLGGMTKALYSLIFLTFLEKSATLSLPFVTASVPLPGAAFKNLDEDVT